MYRNLNFYIATKFYHNQYIKNFNKIRVHILVNRHIMAKIYKNQIYLINLFKNKENNMN